MAHEHMHVPSCSWGTSLSSARKRGQAAEMVNASRAKGQHFSVKIIHLRNHAQRKSLLVHHHNKGNMDAVMVSSTSRWTGAWPSPALAGHHQLLARSSTISCARSNPGLRSCPELSSCWDGQYPLETTEGVSVHLEFGFNMNFILQGRWILLLYNPEHKSWSSLTSLWIKKPHLWQLLASQGQTTQQIKVQIPLDEVSGFLISTYAMENSDRMEIYCLGCECPKETAGELAQPGHSPASTGSWACTGKPDPLQEQGLTAAFSVSIGLQIVPDLTDWEVFWFQ